MFQFLLAGVALAEEMMVSSAAATEVLELTRVSLTAMKWGKNTVDTVQMFLALTEDTNHYVPYEDGEAGYFLFLASDLIDKLKLRDDVVPGRRQTIDAVILDAIESTYSQHPTGQPKALVSSFAFNFGKSLQFAGYPVAAKARTLLFEHQSTIKLYEPLIYRVNNHLTGLTPGATTALSALGMTPVQYSTIVNVLSASIGTDGAVSAVKHGLRGNRAVVHSLLKYDSLIGIMQQGGESVERTLTFPVTSSPGRDFIAVMAATFVPAPVRRNDVFPNLDPVTITKDIVKRTSLLETIKLGYEYNPETRQLEPVDLTATIKPDDVHLGSNEKMSPPALQAATHAILGTLAKRGGKLLGSRLNQIRSASQNLDNNGL